MTVPRICCGSAMAASLLTGLGPAVVVAEAPVEQGTIAQDEAEVLDPLSDPISDLLAARSRTPSQVGSLHRAAGTVEAVLDIYRLALMELLPAIRRVQGAGAAQDARPETAIPAVAVEVFQGVERSVRRRVPEQVLEAIGRGYHAEVTDYLEVLSAAVAVGDVARPARGLIESMSRVCLRADEVVDLFSRNRPIRARVVDKVEILDELTEALEELEAADRLVVRLRKLRAPHDRVAAGYRRLEVALSHVLNLWALARDSGLDFAATGNQIVAGLDVPAQISTDSLETVLERVRHYLHELDTITTEMERVPQASLQSLRATLVEEAGGGAKVDLHWGHAPGRPTDAAVIRVYRADDVATTRRLLTDYLRCRARDEDEARQAVDANMTALSAEPIRVASLEPGRSSWTETLGAAPVAPPIYRIAPVSSYGVEAPSESIVAFALPAVLEGASDVKAELARLRPSQATFYSDFDRVTVTWSASSSEAQDDPDGLAFAVAAGLPTVEAYIVERLSADTEEIIATVRPGVGIFEDRPSVEALGSGVRYRVTVRARDGRLARAPVLCSTSQVIKRELGPLLAAARAGERWVSHPTLWEQGRAVELEDPEHFRRALVAFEERAPTLRDQLLRNWWHETPRLQRVRWLEHWPSLMREEERPRWLRGWHGHLSARDLPWAQSVLFFMAFSDLAPEVDRWWQLLDDATQQRLLAQWRDARSPEYRAWFDGARGGDGPGAARALLPVKQTAWWLSRDPIERRQRLLPWWNTLDEVERHEALLTWYAGLPEPVQRSIRWPTWNRRAQQERDRLLDEGYRVLPPELWRRALAWVEWQSQEGEARLVAIEAELEISHAAVAAVRWRSRPLDVWLDFQLLPLTGLSAAFLLFAFAVWRRVFGSRSGSGASTTSPGAPQPSE